MSVARARRTAEVGPRQPRRFSRQASRSRPWPPRVAARRAPSNEALPLPHDPSCRNELADVSADGLFGARIVSATDWMFVPRVGRQAPPGCKSSCRNVTKVSCCSARARDSPRKLNRGSSMGAPPPDRSRPPACEGGLAGPKLILATSEPSLAAARQWRLSAFGSPATASATYLAFNAATQAAS